MSREPPASEPLIAVKLTAAEWDVVLRSLARASGMAPPGEADKIGDVYQKVRAQK